MKVRGVTYGNPTEERSVTDLSQTPPDRPVNVLVDVQVPVPVSVDNLLLKTFIARGLSEPVARVMLQARRQSSDRQYKVVFLRSF